MKKMCSICGKLFIGWANNANPVNSGECCDVCNLNVVIPARIRAIHIGWQREIAEESAPTATGKLQAGSDSCCSGVNN